MCDFNLVSPEKDVTTNDALHYKRVGENSLLHQSDTQRWYYLSDMREDDLIVFRNVDSEGKLPRKSYDVISLMYESSLKTL
jgi:hypothetical protein